MGFMGKNNKKKVTRKGQKNEQKRTKTNKKTKRNKLLPMLNEVISVYLSTMCNITETAKHF